MFFNSTLSVGQGSVLERNHFGINAVGGSTVSVGNVEILNNSSDGIRLSDTSVAAAFGSPFIHNNGGYGVLCAPPPAVAQLATPDFGTVRDNESGDITCPKPE